MDTNDVLGPSVLIKQWILNAPMHFTTKRFKILFKKFFDIIFFPLLHFWKENLKEYKTIEISESHVTRNTIVPIVDQKNKSRKQHDDGIIEETSNDLLFKLENDEELTLSTRDLSKTVIKETLIQEVGKRLNPNDINKENKKLRSLFIFAVQWSLG